MYPGFEDAATGFFAFASWGIGIGNGGMSLLMLLTTAQLRWLHLVD